MGLSHKKAIRFKYVFPAFISAPSQPDVAADIENRAVANIVAQCTAAAQSCAWPCRLAQLEPLKSPTEKNMSLWVAQICCVYAYARALITRGHERAWIQKC